LKRFLFLLVAFSANALGADYFGAIAYSPSSGADGWSKDQPSRRAAQRAAVEGCKRHAEDCRALFWFKNACGALAVGAGAKAGWGWGKTQKLADGEAIKACDKQAKGCKITRQVCTAGAR
jgi:serine/threonine-protein kinase